MLLRAEWPRPLLKVGHSNGYSLFVWPDAPSSATGLDDFPHVPAAAPGVSPVLVLVPIGPGERFIHAGGG